MTFFPRLEKMDVTPLFKACVKTMKTRNKALGVVVPSGQADSEKNRILSKRKSEFHDKSKDLVSCITKLRVFLLDHRKLYMNISNMMSDSPSMSDVQRDKIDSEAQNIIRKCSQNIRDIHSQVLEQQENSQVLEHREVVVNLLDNYLKHVCKIYSEQRAIRIKRIVDLQKLSKLEPQKTIPSQPDITIPSPTTELPRQSKSQLELSSDDAKSSETTLSDENILSPEEIQMFEEENQKIYEEFSSLSTEIRQIEGKVVEISKLQELFAEKVIDQHKDIDLIADRVIGTTEYIKDGNEELREAMKKNASFRVMILFFLLVLSFSLLFLDWYNP